MCQFSVDDKIIAQCFETRHTTLEKNAIGVIVGDPEDAINQKL